MEAKEKKCHRCGNMRKLWRSNPPTCGPCDRIINSTEPKKQSDKSNDKKRADAERKLALNVFFASQALFIPERCENCLERLILRSSFDRRKSTCHILPKTEHGGFPSVATHPSNKIFMCCDSGCYGHGNWDNKDAASRKEMPVYKLAIERFREFEHLLTPAEQVKAYKYLGLED